MPRIFGYLLVALYLAAATVDVCAVETKAHPPTAETFGAKLRRLAAAAKVGNPAINPPLIGSKPWKVLSGAWAASTAYTVGQLVSNGGVAYICTSAGMSASSGGPTGTSLTTVITDGTARWIYYVGSVGDQVSNGGWVFQIVTAGVPATSGTGPTPSSLTDGSIIWAVVGRQTAPVVTWGGVSHNASYNNRYNLTTTAYLANNTGPIRFTGGVPKKNGGGLYLPSVSSYPQTGNTGGYNQANFQSMQFVLNDSQVEFQFYYGTAARFIVDGSYVSANEFILDLTNGGYVYYTLDFTNVGGRARHDVTVEWYIVGGMAVVSTNPTGTINYPSVQDDFGVAVIGDSMSVNLGGSDMSMAYFTRFAKRVGLPDAVIMGLSGTGMTTSGAYQTYIGHALGDLAALNAFRPLGLIVLQSSYNDAAQANAGALVQAATITLVQAIRAVYPTVPIIVTGYAQNNKSTHPQSNYSTVVEGGAAAGVAAVQAAGDNLTFWIPLSIAVPVPIVTGTGGLGSPTGDGNADYDVASDFLHPSDSGSDLWSRVLEAGYRGIIAQMP